VPRATAILASCLALPAAALAVTGCAGSAKDNRFGTFTDCSKIGPVANAPDPDGDQRGVLAGSKAQPQGDLVDLKVARRNGKLCVQFWAAEPIKPYVAYVLAMRPQDAQTPLVQLEATVFPGEDPHALLQAGGRDGFRTVEATVGVRDNQLSILVDRRPFAAQGVGKVFDAFRFQARSAVVTADNGRLTDCLPSCN
jgi:hypothetical protein